MVTKRARTWLARGTLITVLAIIGTLGIGTWALSGSVASELLLPPDSDSLVTVIAVDAGSVTITADARTVLPGVWGLATDHGAATLGDVVDSDATSVRRALLDRSGVITVGAAAAFQRIVYRPDPEAVGVPFAEVILEGPIGEVSAWTTTGADDTWVVFIHDFDVDGTEAVRVIEVFADLGLPVIVPALRTDVAVAEGGRRTADLGSAGWRDLIPALDFAIASGAQDIVLFGSGTGASSALLAATDSRYLAHIAALVLDGPLLDPADVADRDLAEVKVPGFLVGWAKAVATFRFGIDWAGLDHLAIAAEQTLPVLIFHGDGDDRYPLAASEAYAATAPEVTLVVVPGAGHGETWNVDPVGYRAALQAFLNATVVGPADIVVPEG
jgi:pimeloyl-ACP methyl ester carboxylesterase